MFEMSNPSQHETTINALASILREASGFDLHELDWQSSFLELGFDSLFLIQLSQKIKSQLKVKISFRQLIEEVPTVDELVQYLSQHIPPAEAPQSSTTTPSSPEQLASPPVQLATSQSSNSHSPATPPPTTPPSVQQSTQPPPQSHFVQPATDASSREALAQIISQQNQLMALQLELLSGTPPNTPPMQTVGGEAMTAKEAVSHQPTETSSLTPPSPLASLGETTPATTEPATRPPEQTPTPGPTPKTTSRERFGPYKPVRLSASSDLSKQQRDSLDRLVARFTEKTALSRSHAQKHRKHFADPRGVAGYRRIWKSMVYQITVNRSKGSKLWDIDGNEYVDIAMGFGLNLFGQSPDFITDAVRNQLDHGVEVGPQSPIAGDVAALLCDFSRKDRATFCNTGSEAVMAAMRLARTMTGKSKIVFFNKDYHGNFEEVLLRCSPGPSGLRTTPAAPGIPQSFADSAIVLNYGDPSALDTIRANASDIAAVLVEPVQSADPFLQPREFLHDIRTITRQHDIAMIMDEVITGFRAGQGGAQEYFDVWADMATYGKVLGGGLPIGALAGSSRFMDALDGGMWRYEDDSDPAADMTFFAGTFVRHPLAMVAAQQVLMRVKEEGPELQQRLTQRTQKLADTLNRYFEENLFPIRVAQFTSLFRFMFPADLEYADLLYFHLLDRGIFTRGWADNCFLSTAHTDGDIDKIVAAVIDSCEEIRSGGFMPHPSSSATPSVETASEASVPATDEDRVGQSFPLTETQQEILVTSKISAAASYANNEPFTLHLEGKLHKLHLYDAIQHVLRRHPALHVKIDAARGVQEFAEPRDFEITSHDLTAVADQASQLAKISERFATTPFELEKDPLVRIELVKLSEQEHVLYFDGHHIVTDGWSWNIMLAEIGKTYSSYCTGSPVRLESAGSFRQYVLSTPERDVESKEALDYWLETYRDLPEPLELPTDRPRAAKQLYDAESVIVEFENQTYEAIKTISQRVGCSLFTVGLAAYKILLSKLSGQSDIAVGIRTAGQTAQDNPNLVGLCMNVLPMRTEIEQQKPASDLLKSMHSDVLEAFEHQDCTLGKIVRSLSIQRSPGRMPLTDVHFNLDKDSNDIQLHDLKTTLAMTPKRGINHDLFFNLNETSSGLTAYVDFRSDLLDASTVRRWLKHYEAIILSLAADSQQTIAQVDALTAEQRQQLLVQWNQTQAPYPEKTASQIFEDIAKESPERIAVSHAKSKMTYAQLNAAANRLARHLISAGVQPNTFVGVFLERSERIAIATLALMKIGATYVPMEPDFPDDRLVMMADDAQLQFLVTESHLASRGIAPDANNICLDTSNDVVNELPSSNLEHGVSLSQVAYVIFTSGSTGKPKGVCVTHRALTNFLCSMAKAPGLGADDRLAGVTTLSFDIAGLELYLPLTQGGQLVIVDRRDSTDGRRLAQLLDDEDITVLQATPATFRLMIEAGWTGKSNLKVLCGGEAFPQDLADSLIPRCNEVWNMYGPTETTIWSTIKQLTSAGQPINVGRPIDNTSIFILDQQNSPVPIGATGRLCIGGDGLADGYLDRLELTSERFFQVDGLTTNGPVRIYDTGDQARFLANGEIQFLGRNDHQVKVNGYRIELGEIESIISEHPTVQQAVVATFEDGPHRKLVAFVRGTSETKNYALLRDYLKQRLPSYMLPSAIEFIEQFPLTANGKIDRKRLPKPSQTRPEMETSFQGPRTPTESLLSDIFKQVIKLDRVGIHDDFFELGGHSLSATKIVGRLAGKYPLELSIADVFDTPTIAGLAQKLAPDESPQTLEPSSEELDSVIPRAARELRDLPPEA
ncbi:MAG: hypothetical protein Aurels2KO_22460 [Aureliella sp.]